MGPRVQGESLIIGRAAVLTISRPVILVTTAAKSSRNRKLLGGTFQ